MKTVVLSNISKSIEIVIIMIKAIIVDAIKIYIN